MIVYEETDEELDKAANELQGKILQRRLRNDLLRQYLQAFGHPGFSFSPSKKESIKCSV